jgi:hypothetical protein
MNAHKMAKLDMTLRHFPHINGMCYGRGAIRLTEVTVTDKLEGFRAFKFDIISMIFLNFS